MATKTKSKVSKKEQFSELLLQVNNDLAITNSLDEALESLVGITTSIIKCERGTIFLNDSKTEELYSRVAQGNFMREIRFMNSKGVAGWSYTNEKGAIVDDAYKDDRFNKNVDIRTGFRTKSILCTPLRTVSGKKIGVSQLLNKKDDKFSEEDLELLEAMTAQAAIAIQSHVALEQMEANRQKEKEFMELVGEISSELELSSLLSKIIATITTMLEAERSSLFINDEKTNELYTMVGEGLSEEIRFPNHMGIAGAVFTSGETVNIPHAYADLRFNPGIDKTTGFFTRSMLCAPVINKDGKIIGVSQVLNKQGGGFTDEDVLKLTAFTSQISIGIENASLFVNIQNLVNYNESMLNSMSNGVITIDGEGLVERCNPAGVKILQLESDELILKKEFKTIFKGKNKWIVEKIEKIETTEFLPDAELEFSGEKISTNITLMPLKGTEDESLGTLLMIEDISSEKRMKSTMSRYMDADLADQLLAGGDGEDVMGGKESIGTVLFSDIRSFTNLTESLGAQGTVGFLNDYFTIMVDCIQDEGGMLDKFIGDAIMAIFGTPVAHDDDPDRGLRAAIQMMHGLNEFNDIRKSQGLPPVDHGMGLNTDEIVSGNIGSPKRMDYTVIGDGVNLAARIESSCKKYGAKILMSEYTFKALKATYRTRQVDCVIVKGKTEPVHVFEVLDFHSKESFPNMIEVLEMFNNGIEYYNEGNWDKAIVQFKKAQKGNPDDKASNMYVERCEVLKKRDPKDWNGVWVATSK
ncbi:MAG: adenylate/guanylate cyclase domain-containing protein [Flavobacteriaceae bacterium TMED238]|nr:MAG: adenylate/guanylate cyclase domain-containing protein [Flavobacteriaceae bacterium TMED238]